MNTNTKVSTRAIRPTHPQAASTHKAGTWWRSGGVALALLPALMALLTGCQEPQPVWPSIPDATPGVTALTATATAPAAASSPATRLREGDVIQVAFEAETNLNTVAKIQLDGTVVLPMVGSVQAVGRTLEDMQVSLRKSYEKFIKTSDLTVTLTTTSASIYVSGAVLRPGRIPLDRPLTAMEAIMEAGGFDLARAKPSDVSVLRMENGQQKRYRLNLKSALREGDASPFQLRPFDIVHVPEKTFNL